MDLIDKINMMVDSAGNPKAGEKWKWSNGKEFTIINVGSGMGPGGKYIDVKFKGEKQTRGIKMTDFFAAGKGATIIKEVVDRRRKITGDAIRKIGQLAEKNDWAALIKMLRTTADTLDRF